MENTQHMLKPMLENESSKKNTWFFNKPSKEETVRNENLKLHIEPLLVDPIKVEDWIHHVYEILMHLYNRIPANIITIPDGKEIINKRNESLERFKSLLGKEAEDNDITKIQNNIDFVYNKGLFIDIQTYISELTRIYYDYEKLEITLVQEHGIWTNKELKVDKNKMQFYKIDSRISEYYIQNIIKQNRHGHKHELSSIYNDTDEINYLDSKEEEDLNKKLEILAEKRKRNEMKMQFNKPIVK